MKLALATVIAITSCLAWAGGSNYGVAPGSNANFTGKVCEYGNGKLAKLDPTAMKVVKEYQLPHSDAGAYAVNTDGAGIVWVNEINTDTVGRFDPKTEQMRVVKLPSTGGGIRKMAVDAQGRLWYMGSHNGRLGVVE